MIPMGVTDGKVYGNAEASVPCAVHFVHRV